MAGALRTVAKEISKYKLDLVRVQVRWDGDGTNLQTNIHFSIRRGMKIMN
jgi:hypothetical protein